MILLQKFIHLECFKNIVKGVGFSFFFILISSQVLQGQGIDSNVRILDEYHYSKVFAANRNYRIFLPPSYSELSGKKYPVIYFFHGWAQRYFGGMGKGYSDYDKGDDNDGDNFEKFVSENDVIVVKIDGLNQFGFEPRNLTPYNISSVTTFREFPEYFKELVRYIDDHYHTIPDRDHRGVSGLSMGGFMTFWIAEKFPDMVSASGNFCGSTEFPAGPLEFPVVYTHAEMYGNFKGISVRMHNGNSDRLRFYHDDMNRVLMNAIPQYQFKQYEASHTTCGLGDMFHFILESFKSPLPLPDRWDYIDVFPFFEVWNYRVETTRDQSGFTILKNVDKHGFNVAVRNFLPDGELFPHVSVKVITAPVYDKNTLYTITDVDIRNDSNKSYAVQSDGSGRLEINTNGSLHTIGIERGQKKANLTVSKLNLENSPWAETGKNVDFSLQILNKGLGVSQDIHAEITPISKDIEIVKGTASITDLKPLESKKLNQSFRIINHQTGVDIALFQVTLKDKSGQIWKEDFDIRVKDPVDEIHNIVLADGKEMTVVKAAVDSVHELIGYGNGDGIPNPGESIEILVMHEGRLLRTNAYSSNQNVNQNNTNIRIPDPWQEYDHIGGAFKYTRPVLISSTPEGEEIPFYIEYWLPGEISGEHIIKRGFVKIKVEGSDQTPPRVEWVHVVQNKKVEVRAYDGDKIKNVRLTLTPNPEKAVIRYVTWEQEPSKKTIKLWDDGTHGDTVAGDGIFSIDLEDQPTYIYDLSIELEDIHGNRGQYDHDEPVYIRDPRVD